MLPYARVDYEIPKEQILEQKTLPQSFLVHFSSFLALLLLQGFSIHSFDIGIRPSNDIYQAGKEAPALIKSLLFICLHFSPLLFIRTLFSYYRLDSIQSIINTLTFAHILLKWSDISLNTLLIPKLSD